MVRVQALRSLFGACLLAVVMGGPGLLSPAWAQGSFPDRPIRVIVPFTPGGANDVLARFTAPGLQARLGQPVVVENRPGAGGNIGGEFVAKSAPDGYTLLIAQNGLTMAPWLEKMSYDPMALAPITISMVSPVLMAVNNEMPVRSVAELIAYARANPGKISYATPGIGTPHHLFTELFLSLTGTTMVMIPYKGVAGIVTDLIGGRVNLVLSTVATLAPPVTAGKIQGLGVGELKRLAGLPSIPAVAETVPGFNVNFWMGFSAPTGTPEAITHKLSDELRAVMKLPDVAERLTKSGYEITSTTPAEMRTIMRSDYDKWGKVVKEAGIRLN